MLGEEDKSEEEGTGKYTYYLGAQMTSSTGVLFARSPYLLPAFFGVADRLLLLHMFALIS